MWQDKLLKDVFLMFNDDYLMVGGKQGRQKYNKEKNFYFYFY